MRTPIQIPSFLAPDESVRGIEAFRILGIFELVDRFANEYQVEHEIAFTSLLAGFGHSIGGAFEIDSALGKIRSPFSLLLVTPETEAIWSRIPNRFVVDDFEGTMRAFSRVNLGNNKLDKDTEAAPSDPEADGLAQAVETAKSVYAGKVAERITTSSLAAPFLREPFDHHVLLTAPPTGLSRAFSQLSSDERFRLEQALCSNSPMPPRTGEVSGGVPSFFWQVDRHEARRFIEQNPWFAWMPFLMLESTTPGVAKLEVDRKSAGEIHRRCFELFVMRHVAMRRPTTFSVRDDATFRPLGKFLTKAHAWETKFETPSLARPARVAEHALRFALLFTILDKKPEPDEAAVFMGLELAKRLHIRHLKTLAKFLPIAPSEVPDTEGLSDLERRVYFRVCKRPGLSPSKLGRTFRGMMKTERDQLIATLMGRRLVELRDGGLYQAGIPPEQPSPKRSNPDFVGSRAGILVD
jgi:hypothetical protein